MLFYDPKRIDLTSKANFTTVFQTESRILEVFLPATTKVVRRDRIGAAHLHESGSAPDDQGPFIFDIAKSFQIGGEEASTTEDIDASTKRIIKVDNSSPMPDEPGNLVFAFGTKREEGPVPYIARPSTDSILLDPSYRFKNKHDSGTNVSLISQNFPLDPDTNGSDYAFYLTDIVSGRLFAEDLVNLVVATGITIVFIVLFPGDEGLGKYKNPKLSEKTFVWGEDS